MPSRMPFPFLFRQTDFDRIPAPQALAYFPFLWYNMENTNRKEGDLMKHLMLIAALLCLTGCSAEKPDFTFTIASSLPAQTTAPTGSAASPTITQSATQTITQTTTQTEATAEPARQGQLLSSPEDIALTCTDGIDRSYTFTYDGTAFTAVYTPDNWKIIDSWRITDNTDMIIICEALMAVHPIHGADLVSYRDAEDMAYEWEQHNIAYLLLPDDSPWKMNAKDVDINPADQGKSVYELYQDRISRS